MQVTNFSRLASQQHEDSLDTGGEGKGASHHPSRSASPQFKQMLSLMEIQRQEIEAQRREDQEEHKKPQKVLSVALLCKERRDVQF